MPRKRSKMAIPTTPQCTALVIPASDRAMCKLHACYLRRETVELEGDEIQVWTCPVTKKIIDFPTI